MTFISCGRGSRKREEVPQLPKMMEAVKVFVYCSNPNRSSRETPAKTQKPHLSIHTQAEKQSSCFVGICLVTGALCVR